MYLMYHLVSYIVANTNVLFYNDLGNDYKQR